VILVADQEKTAEQVKKAFEEHRVKKTYVALVFGWPKENEAVWRDRIEIQRDGGKVRAKVGPGVWAEAKMKVRERLSSRLGPVAMLELQPKTGRTHQLRIQCAHRGLPLVGDQTYGDFGKNGHIKTAALFLHAESVELAIQDLKFRPHVLPPEHFMVFKQK